MTSEAELRALRVAEAHFVAIANNVPAMIEHLT
jgi:hypothetical protein